jgi:hypothetical protein
LSNSGPTQNREKQYFVNCWIPVKDGNFFVKHHLFVYIKYMIDQNLEGLAQKIGLPRPSEVQN